MKFFRRIHASLRLNIRGYVLFLVSLIALIQCIYYLFVVLSLDQSLKQSERQTSILDPQKMFANVGARIGWLIDIAIVLFFLVVFLYLLSNVVVVFYRSHRRYTSHGSAHYATLKEVRASPFYDEAMQPRLWIGRVSKYKIGLTYQQQQSHLLCLGDRAASTQAIIEPALTEGETGLRSLLFVDTDGQLSEKTQHLGHWGTIYRFALHHSSSICYNPLGYIRSVEDAKAFSVCWLANTEGIHDELTTLHLLLTATVLHVVQNEPQAPLTRLSDLLSTTTITALRTLLLGSVSPDAQVIAGTFFNTHSDPTSAGKILAELATRFLVMRDPQVRSITAKNTLHFSTLNEHPSVFILQMQQTDERAYAPLVACLFLHLIQCIQEKPQARPFALYLPYLPQVGYIPHFSEYLTSPGLAFIAGIDQLGQLRDLYGQEEARLIRDRIATHVLFRSCMDGEFYSKRIGTRTVLKPSRRRDYRTFWRRLIEGPYYLERGEPLLTADQIRFLPSDELLLVRRDVPPVKVRRLTA